MSIFIDYMEKMLGKYIVIVQKDNREFRGLLKEFDDENIVLDDVIETALSDAYWKRPAINVPPKEEHDDIGFKSAEGESVIIPFTEGIFRIDGIMRVWIWPNEKLKLEYKTPLENVTVQRF